MKLEDDVDKMWKKQVDRVRLVTTTAPKLLERIDSPHNQ